MCVSFSAAAAQFGAGNTFAVVGGLGSSPRLSRDIQFFDEISHGWTMAEKVN